MSHDLFGPEPPAKDAPGYLDWLRSLDWPRIVGAPGLTFVARSKERNAPRAPDKYVDVVILEDPQGKWWQVVIDLRTGEKYAGERRA